MWLAVPQQNPEEDCKAGRGQGGSSLVWLARVRVVSEKTRETKENGPGSRGVLLRRGSLSMINEHIAAQHSPAGPGQSSKAVGRAKHGRAEHSMTVICAAVG